MKNGNKKIAAALAAVSTYLQEEGAAQQQAGQIKAAFQPAPSLNVWGLSGRQEMMSMRQLIQMKAFSKL